MRRARSAGFTLIELLVVLVILGLLLGLVGPRVLDYLGTAKSDTAALQIKQLSATLDLMRIDIGRYPTQEEGLQALMTQPKGVKEWSGPYLKSVGVPNDPWDQPYIYRFPGLHGQPFDLLSLGADGREGGDGENQDVTSWQ
tara:strand:- start:163 stop:585 length:423 start_codon:yes stop_codon:yes gene_type:complete